MDTTNLRSILAEIPASEKTFVKVMKNGIELIRTKASESDQADLEISTMERIYWHHSKFSAKLQSMPVLNPTFGEKGLECYLRILLRHFLEFLPELCKFCPFNAMGPAMSAILMSLGDRSVLSANEVQLASRAWTPFLRPIQYRMFLGRISDCIPETHIFKANIDSALVYCEYLQKRSNKQVGEFQDNTLKERTESLDILAQALAKAKCSKRQKKAVLPNADCLLLFETNVTIKTAGANPGEEYSEYCSKQKLVVFVYSDGNVYLVQKENKLVVFHFKVQQDSGVFGSGCMAIFFHKGEERSYVLQFEQENRAVEFVNVVSDIEQNLQSERPKSARRLRPFAVVTKLRSKTLEKINM
eukprot:TRINITY_DN7979_c0_g1_i1.p1 TRINITY_DN7979_c0_g1~~TRINITY_DN7979_c0_g1_i1.p1  ORF type:complete len:357 (+),score=44.79 TRINITY_DN7979_c0_g1_i1:2-1072(+)